MNGILCRASGNLADNKRSWSIAALILDTRTGGTQRYGVGGATPTNLMQFAKALITTAKAFKANLTTALILLAMEDDPHGAFMTDPSGALNARVQGGAGFTIVLVETETCRSRRGGQPRSRAKLLKLVTSGGCVVLLKRNLACLQPIIGRSSVMRSK
jgi:hypothetical protein